MGNKNVFIVLLKCWWKEQNTICYWWHEMEKRKNTDYFDERKKYV